MPGRPKPPNKLAEALDLVAVDGSSKTDEQINKLQEELTRERDGRREDRFLFIAISTVLLDISFFTVLNAGAAVAIVILELLILFVVARRMGMEEVVEMLSSLLRRTGGKGLDP
jgi:hypothetical protein